MKNLDAILAGLPLEAPVVNRNSWHFKMKPGLERVLIQSSREGDCAAFHGERSADGYGRIYVAGRHWMVHRFMWEQFRGEIPEGLQADHLCMNEWCWNPHHIEIVTPRINALRSSDPPAKNAIATHCKRDHPLSGDNLTIWMRKGKPVRVCLECRRAYGRKKEGGRPERWKKPAF